MEILKFTLSGGKATFTRPYFNSYYSTYSHIHKVALLGLLGAMIGIPRKITEDGTLLAYNELESLKISIVPHKLHFPEVRNTITETTGMYNAGFTYVADYIELCNPAWDIYIYSNENKNYDKVKEFVIGKKSVFNIYLGKNQNFASITNPKIIKGEEVENIENIDSFFIADEVETEEDDNSYDRIYFKEVMPVSMDRILNQYVSKRLILTNEKVVWCNDYKNIINCEGKNLYMI